MPPKNWAQPLRPWCGSLRFGSAVVCRDSGAAEVAQLLDGPWRHEARADQAVRQQIGDPHRVVHVGLAAAHVADVRCVGQHQLELAFEHVPHRLPVHARGLPRHVGAIVLGQPVGQLKQLGGRGAEAGTVHTTGCAIARP